MHIIGHSLGGQAAGAAGKYIQKPRIGRISGELANYNEFYRNLMSPLIDPAWFRPFLTFPKL